MGLIAILRELNYSFALESFYFHLAIVFGMLGYLLWLLLTGSMTAAGCLVYRVYKICSCCVYKFVIKPKMSEDRAEVEV